MRWWLALALIALTTGIAWADDDDDDDDDDDAEGGKRHGLVFYVNPAGSDSAAGTSPSAAFKTIQKAVNSCATGKGGYTIRIAPGTYAEQVDMGINDGRAAKGGKSDNPNRLIGDVSGTSTGVDAGDVVIEGGGSLAYGIIQSGIDHWRVEGLTIRGQTTVNVSLTKGKDWTISGCDVRVSPGYGVLALQMTDFAVEQCTFDRTASSGHGLYLQHHDNAGYLKVNRNRLNRTGSLYGTSGYADGASPSRNKASNSSSMYGIMLFGGNSGSKTTIECTNNIVTDALYGIYCYAYKKNSTVNATNNTITHCYMPLYVYGEFASGAIHNNIVAKCYYSAYLCCANVTLAALLEHGNKLTRYATVKSSAGLVSGDPLFMDAAAGDFRPRAGSPAINIGVEAGAPAVDLAGVARSPGSIDIGALEAGAARRARPRILSWDGHFRKAREGRDVGPGRGILDGGD